MYLNPLRTITQSILNCEYYEKKKLGCMLNFLPFEMDIAESLFSHQKNQSKKVYLKMATSRQLGFLFWNTAKLKAGLTDYLWS